MSDILPGSGIWGLGTCSWCGSYRQVERLLDSPPDRPSLRCAECQEAARWRRRRAQYMDATPGVEDFGLPPGWWRLYESSTADATQGGPDPMSKQVPSVGRVVHYFAYGTPGGEFPAGVARAAIITEVDTQGDPESALGLCVLNPTGIFFNQHVPYGNTGGHWAWPVFVPPVESK